MKVVIVEGMAGGVGMATRLRRNDETAKIIMLEREPYISYANYSLPYYIGGMVADKDILQLQTPERFHTRLNVDVRMDSQVVSTDTKKKYVVVRHGEETYEESYDKLVLSPGAGLVQPDIPGIGENHVLTLRNMLNTCAIYNFIKEHKPVSCVVIGAGFIGPEMVENLAEQGIRVSVVGGAVHVMLPIDMDMAHAVYNYIRAQGIGLYLRHTCTVVDKDGIILDNSVRVLVDMVIMSIGVHPDTGFLKGSAVELGARGEILVGQCTETSAEDVYAPEGAMFVKHVASGQEVLIPLASLANK